MFESSDKGKLIYCFTSALRDDSVRYCIGYSVLEMCWKVKTFINACLSTGKVLKGTFDLRSLSHPLNASPALQLGRLSMIREYQLCH